MSSHSHNFCLFPKCFVEQVNFKLKGMIFLARAYIYVNKVSWECIFVTFLSYKEVLRSVWHQRLSNQVYIKWLWHCFLHIRYDIPFCIRQCKMMDDGDWTLSRLFTVLDKAMSFSKLIRSEWMSKLSKMNRNCLEPISIQSFLLLFFFVLLITLQVLYTWKY